MTVAVNQDIATTGFFSGLDGNSVAIGLVYDTLIDMSPQSLEARPALAESWEVSEDGTEVSLRLRDDVTFHSGRKFTAKDVEFSIKTYASPEWAPQFMRVAAAVKGFRSDDPHEITLVLDHPMGNVLDLLDVMPIIDRKSMDEFRAGKDFIGTGAFEFKSWTPNTEAVFTANADYWDGAPYLDGVKLKVVQDPQAQVSQLRSGQLDVAFNASSLSLETLEASGQAKVIPFEGSERTLYMGVNVANPTLSDLRLRKAIAYAADRERIVGDVFQGSAEVRNLPWPEYSSAFDDDANRTYTRDSQRARDLVDQVGSIPVLPITYMTGQANYETAAQILQENLQEVGIPTRLDPVDVVKYRERLVTGTFDGLWIGEHSGANFTPSTLALTAYPLSAEMNASNFEDEEYRSHAEAAWKVADGTSNEAMQAYDALSRDLLDNLFVIELVEFTRSIATSPYLYKVSWSKSGEIDLSKAFLSE